MSRAGRHNYLSRSNIHTLNESSKTGEHAKFYMNFKLRYIDDDDDK